jgi:hypothetical protein
METVGTFKEKKFYQEQRTGRAFAVLGSVSTAYWPYTDQTKNLIVQFDDSRIVLVNYEVSHMVSTSGMDEVWEEIKLATWLKILRDREKKQRAATRKERG